MKRSVTLQLNGFCILMRMNGLLRTCRLLLKIRLKEKTFLPRIGSKEKIFILEIMNGRTLKDLSACLKRTFLWNGREYCTKVQWLKCALENLMDFFSITPIETLDLWWLKQLNGQK